LTAEELLDFVKPRLAGFKIPKTVDFVTELPKSGTGKILKRVLKEKYWEHLSRKVGT
jgi:acyl-CoA synthetase (AMP-forming)/AMP-acid ligase II